MGGPQMTFAAKNGEGTPQEGPEPKSRPVSRLCNGRGLYWRSPVHLFGTSPAVRDACALGTPPLLAGLPAIYACSGRDRASRNLYSARPQEAWTGLSDARAAVAVTRLVGLEALRWAEASGVVHQTSQFSEVPRA